MVTICYFNKYSKVFIICITVDNWCTCVAWSRKHPTLDFGSSHALRVPRLRPVSGCTLGVEPA